MKCPYCHKEEGFFQLAHRKIVYEFSPDFTRICSIDTSDDVESFGIRCKHCGRTFIDKRNVDEFLIEHGPMMTVSPNDIMNPDAEGVL